MSDRRESSTHRSRVQGAVGRYLARRAPAGFHPANALAVHVVMAGSSITCLACGHEDRLPLPRDPKYSSAVDEYLERHRLCQAAGQGAKP